jgi:hypothetical protein
MKSFKKKEIMQNKAVRVPKRVSGYRPSLSRWPGGTGNWFKKGLDSFG